MAAEKNQNLACWRDVYSREMKPIHGARRNTAAFDNVWIYGEDPCTKNSSGSWFKRHCWLHSIGGKANTNVYWLVVLLAIRMCTTRHCTRTGQNFTQNNEDLRAMTPINKSEHKSFSGACCCCFFSSSSFCVLVTRLSSPSSFPCRLSIRRHDNYWRVRHTHTRHTHALHMRYAGIDPEITTHEIVCNRNRWTRKTSNCCPLVSVCGVMTGCWSPMDFSQTSCKWWWYGRRDARGLVVAHISNPRLSPSTRVAEVFYFLSD